MPLEVMVRFGLWDEILAEPERYTESMWFTRAFHHATRAIASAAKSDTASARKAQSVFLERAKLVPKEESLGNNSCEAILDVMKPMVEGEILVAEGKTDSGIKQLRAAIKKEDVLKYDEPPGWLSPVRHSLGFFSSRRRHTRLQGDWSSDVCSSDLCRSRAGSPFITAPRSVKCSVPCCPSRAKSVPGKSIR